MSRIQLQEIAYVFRLTKSIVLPGRWYLRLPLPPTSFSFSSRT